MASDALAPLPPFYVEWKPLITLPQHAKRPKYYRRPSLLSPPDTKEAFQTQSSDPVIYKWTPGSLEAVSAQEKRFLLPYRTCSVCWRPDHQSCLTVPYDCTEESVREKARTDPFDHWEPLKFTYESIDARCVSVVGHYHGSDILAAAGPPNWLGELIPPRHQRHEGPAIPETTGTSYLAGDLSIIIALAALSNDAEVVKHTIEESFRPQNSTTWRPHGQMDQSVQPERGMVVKIFFDRRITGARDHLEEWYNGRTRAVLS